jgi:hypothetical protein
LSQHGCLTISHHYYNSQPSMALSSPQPRHSMVASPYHTTTTIYKSLMTQKPHTHLYNYQIRRTRAKLNGITKKQNQKPKCIPKNPRNTAESERGGDKKER